MIPHTVPVKASEQQIVALMKHAQQTPRPLFLSIEGVEAPMAVLMKMDAYEKTQRQQYRFYHLLITQLGQWLDRVEEQWDNGELRRECVATWQNSIDSLWEAAPEPVQELCGALFLAVKELDATGLSADQIAALRYCLTLLRDSNPDEAAIEEAHQRLTASGLSPLLSFEDDSFAELYIEES